MTTGFPKKILLVEDDNSTALITSYTLRKCGYEVLTAETGESAVEIALNDNSINLILMDIELGKGIDGTEAATRILEKVNIPIVFHTTHSEQEYVQKFKKITRYGYINKNCGEYVLCSSLEMAFELFDASQELLYELRERKRVEEEIKAEAAKQALILNNIPCIAMILRKETREIVFSNTVAQEFGAYPGKVCFEIWKVNEQPCPFCLVDDVGDVNSTRKKEFSTGNKYYEATWVSLNKDYLLHYIFDITERKIIELHKEKQLHYTTALNKIAEIILNEENAEILLESSNRILGETLDLDRALIYEISFKDNAVSGLCEWVKPELSDIAPTKARYPLDMFRSPFSVIRQTNKYLESHFDNIKEPFLADGSGETLHGYFKIKSLLWYPFAFTENGFYIFALNHLTGDRQWLQDEIIFMEAVSKYVSIALLKICMLDERKLSEEALRESEEKYRLLHEHAGIGIGYYKPDGTVISYNRLAAAHMNGVPEDFAGRSIYDIFPHQEAEFYHDRIKRAVESEVPVVYEDLVQLPLENKYFLSTFTKITDAGNNVLGIQIISQDVSILKNTEASLRESEKRFQVLENASWEGILIHKDGVIVDANESAARILGCSINVIIGKNMTDFVTPKSLDNIRNNLQNSDENDEVFFEGEGLRIDKTVFSVEALARSIIYNNTNMRVVVFRDITDRMQAEKTKSLLEINKVILREVHHRVKNNMNTIVALLSLQAGHLTEPSAIEAINDARSRVQSMGILYDKLFNAANYKEMSVQEFLPQLIDQTISLFPNRGSITIEKNIADIILDSTILSPLGLILSELLTNIMKYAFTGINEGLVSVSVFQKEQKVFLEVLDNGIGISDIVDFENSTGFGLTLIGLLTKQLDGNIRIERENGTKIILEFKP